MKIVSFNVNGIRARLHQLETLVVEQQPDIIALQETKVQDAEFPRSAIEALGYRAAWFGQKTHYGVALLHRREPLRVDYGFADDSGDAQKRLIAATYEIGGDRTLRVINGYFPQGENRDHAVKFPGKERFFASLHRHLVEQEDAGGLVLVAGDMNVAPQDLDVGIGADNARRWLRTGKCSFLPEERDWLQNLLDWGLADSFRELHPDCGDRFSWFDYRSRGFEREPRRGLRIDLLLASRPLQECCTGAGIDYRIRAMGRPSDHAPVWAEYDFDNEVT